ncbi:DUF2628 domain-containing protein [Methylocapsa aurea]|uniref:DUF2628 domain-containing protein n=1 Tax=Methylocapsa aurea TaxID=663610 RepID=UPI000562A821|nr:DUF2628 domain-containing protein [Methylocapsa aurea]
MAVYSVHLQGDDASDLTEAAFTRSGFEWAAFLNGPFWLLGHRLWLAAALWTASLLLLVVLVSLGFLSPGAGLTLILLLEILLGLEANRLLEARLERRGYRLVEIIAAPARDEAEAAFYRRLETLDAPAPPEPGPRARSPAPHHDVLGHFPEPGGRR